MSSILELLSQNLDENTVSSIAERLGADPNTTNAVVSHALPLLVSALARNASQPDGAEALHQALTNDHSGSILDTLSDHVVDPQAANGAGILNHVLGDQQSAVTEGLAKATGLDAGSVGQILQVVAPIVMGAVGRATQKNGLDANGLSSMLANEHLSAQESMPDVMGLVGSLLHRLPRPGDGFDISTGRQLYESAQLVAIPLGAAAFVQVAALAVTFAGILMLALLA